MNLGDKDFIPSTQTVYPLRLGTVKLYSMTLKNSTVYLA